MRKKILFKAPVLTRSGYGEQSRYALRALRSREDIFDIFVLPLQWGHTSWIGEDTEERQWIDIAIEKTINYTQMQGQFDLSFQVTIANEWEQHAPINIGYTAGIETTQVAPQWLAKGNEMNKIIVVSTFARDMYKNCQYTGQNEQTGQEVLLSLNTPIEAINYPAKKFDELPEVELELDYDFNFLTTAQISPRKNVQNTIKWFVEEFRDEEVGLVVKGNLAKNCLMDREHLFNDLRNFINGLGEKKCKVYLLHGDMTDEEMHSLQRHPKISAFVSLAHGEGFGLPIYEAAYSGTPVVATGWSGHLDFLVDEKGKEHFYNVNFDLNKVPDEVVWEGVIVKDSMWAYPREQSAKEQMRQCYDDITGENADSHALKACEYADELQERFAKEKMYEKFVSAVEELITDDSEDWLSEIEEIVQTYE
jgi:glycosyltransferase involved in cell wall biosynthesis